MVDMLVVVLDCLYVDTWAVGNVCTPLETFTAGLNGGLAWFTGAYHIAVASWLLGAATPARIQVVRCPTTHR
jgi:hypothetical protein